MNFFWKHCRKFPHFLVILMICLLLNLWDSSFIYLFAVESLNFLYCWNFEIICCCWTFGFSILLNLWDYALDYVSVYCSTFEIICCCWTFEIMPWIMYLHTQSIVCATVSGQCLEYLVYITLPSCWKTMNDLIFQIGRKMKRKKKSERK